ncbi:MAG: hypothetical protein ACRD0K_28020, partial [Egibacteraceae bacterium]
GIPPRSSTQQSPTPHATVPPVHASSGWRAAARPAADEAAAPDDPPGSDTERSSLSALGEVGVLRHTVGAQLLDRADPML